MQQAPPLTGHRNIPLCPSLRYRKFNLSGGSVPVLTLASMMLLQLHGLAERSNDRHSHGAKCQDNIMGARRCWPLQDASPLTSPLPPPPPPPTIVLHI